ncbi:hypothetical protein ABKV19_003153 [Rosa sericea]
MDSGRKEPTTVCHVVAMPYPGRGHVNPMMNLCKVLASQNSKVLITFVVTEEWLSFIGSEPKPDNFVFATIPNVIPSELVRAAHMVAFFEALMTKMEAPFDLLVDRLEPPPSLIVGDTYLPWAVRVGNRRRIPAASFWPMSASVFSAFQHFHLFKENGHFPMDLSGNGNDRVDYIPGVSSTPIQDFPPEIQGKYPTILRVVLEAFSWVPKAQYLLFSSIYELETEVIDVLRSEFSLPVYTVGPLIPYFKANDHRSNVDHSQWLDTQPCSSVLYISMGSFMSVSSAQMDEIAAGLHKSSVRFFWVARGETDRLREVSGCKGLVVPWCDQLSVLNHSCIGGFLTHCGWNSVKEGVSAGVPFLTFPLNIDQGMNSKAIVEDWKIGWRVKSTEAKIDHLVTSEEIAGLVKKFMDTEDGEGKDMRRRARNFQQIFHGAIAEGGSSESNISAFISDIC